MLDKLEEWIRKRGSLPRHYDIKKKKKLFSILKMREAFGSMDEMLEELVVRLISDKDMAFGILVNCSLVLRTCADLNETVEFTLENIKNEEREEEENGEN